MDLERGSKVANILIAIGSLGALCIGSFNSCQLLRQANTASDTLDATRTQAGLAKTQADLAAQQASTADHQAQTAVSSFEESQKQSRAAQLASVTQLTAECRGTTQLTTTSFSPAAVWEDLCPARHLSYEIVIHDFIGTTAAELSLTNLAAIKEASIHLEDALVRALGSAAHRILDLKVKAAGKLADDDLCRAREFLIAQYLFDKPRDPAKSLEDVFALELEDHRAGRDAGKDVAHAARMVDFASAVDQIHGPCKP